MEATHATALLLYSAFSLVCKNCKKCHSAAGEMISESKLAFGVNSAIRRICVILHRFYSLETLCACHCKKDSSRLSLSTLSRKKVDQENIFFVYLCVL